MIARDVVLIELKDQITKVQNKMKQMAEGHRRNVKFHIRDMVYLKLQKNKMKSLAKRYNKKLTPKFFGPYKVLQKTRPVAYKLQFLDTVAIHPVFNVSRLKKAVGDMSIVQNLPPTLTDVTKWLFEPELVKDVREGPEGTEFLIKWCGLPNFEST